MKKNMGTIDRSIRLILAAVFVILYLTGVVPGVVGIILIVVACIFTITSFIGFCPLYTILRVSTCKVK